MAPCAGRSPRWRRQTASRRAHTAMDDFSDQVDETVQNFASSVSDSVGPGAPRPRAPRAAAPHPTPRASRCRFVALPRCPPPPQALRAQAGCAGPYRSARQQPAGWQPGSGGGPARPLADGAVLNVTAAGDRNHGRHFHALCASARGV